MAEEISRMERDGLFGRACPRGRRFGVVKWKRDEGRLRSGPRRGPYAYLKRGPGGRDMWEDMEVRIDQTVRFNSFDAAMKKVRKLRKEAKTQHITDRATVGDLYVFSVFDFKTFERIGSRP